MPKVSIIIPIYNVEKYLPACLDSVLAQTFTNWEAVCVNDGSTDKCGQILKKYAKKDRRIKIIAQKNQGVSVARKTGLIASQGDYICFLDSDDELAPIFLERMYHLIIENKADIAVCRIQMEKKTNVPKEKILAFKNVFNHFMEEKPNMLYTLCNKMYQKDIFKDIIFTPGQKYGEDQVVLYQAMYNSRKTAYTPLKLYFYRQHSDSIMHASFGLETIFGNIELACFLNNYFSCKKMSQKSRKILNRKIAQRIFKFCILEPKRKTPQKVDYWYKITRPLLKTLKNQNLYQPAFLSLMNQFKSWLFLKGEKND